MKGTDDASCPRGWAIAVLMVVVGPSCILHREGPRDPSASPPPASLQPSLPRFAVAVDDRTWVPAAAPAHGPKPPAAARTFHDAPPPERWKLSLAGYVTAVRRGNQRSLKAAAAPFADFVNAMHERIHPIFADGFLAPLDDLPSDHPLNDQNLATRLEIVVAADGSIQRMGVVNSSGVEAFDVGVLDSIDRAQPFARPAPDIQSSDGNVYVQWQFYRNEVNACGTRGARPLILER